MNWKLSMTLFLTLASLAAGCASTKGPQVARQDIADGDLRWRIYGEVFPWDADYGRLLQDRVGVRLDRVAGCVVTSELVNEANGYNRVMQAEIERRYGAGILERLMKEAESSYLLHPTTTPAPDAAAG